MSAGLRGSVRTPGQALADTVVLVGVLALVLWPLVDVFGGRTAVPALAGGLLLGVAVAFASAARRWSALTVVAATVAVFLLGGGPLALPGSTIAGSVPTGATFTGLARGAVAGWKQIVTLQPPVGPGAGVVAAYVLALVSSVAAVATALRLRRSGAAAAALVPVATLVVVILLGTRFPTVDPVTTGVVLAVVLLPWAAWRTQALRLRRVVATGVLAAVAVGAGVAGAPLVVADTPRYVVRDEIVPPFDPRDYPSPLSAFRRYAKDQKEATLLTVTGLPAGARVRLATMDRYDGVVWNVAGDGSAEASGEFRRIGDEVPTSVTGEPARVTVEVGELTGVWLPTVGQATGIDVTGAAPDLRFNDATGAAVLTGGLRPGLTYTLDVVVPEVPDDAAVGSAAGADVPQPTLAGVPDVVAVTSADVARDAGHPVEIARALATWLSEEGFFSDGQDPSAESVSLSGHGADRIGTLLGGGLMVGDGEQYAAAMALMVREMGLPARVVLGFRPDEPTEAGAPVEVTGDDVEAWVEVAFEGVGWVPFDPTPPREQTPDTSDVERPAEPDPQVVQPPPPPPAVVTPPDEDTEQPVTEPTDESDDAAAWWRAALRVGGIVAVPLVLLALPFLVVGAVKARRRRRRRRRGDTVTRVAGGWSEVLDQARDLRHPVAPRATRRESAAALAASADPAGTVLAGRVHALARAADRAVFAAGEPSDQEVRAYWTAVDETLVSLRRGVGWRRRTRARLSLASLRTRPRGRRR